MRRLLPLLVALRLLGLLQASDLSPSPNFEAVLTPGFSFYAPVLCPSQRKNSGVDMRSSCCGKSAVRWATLLSSRSPCDFIKEEKIQLPGFPSVDVFMKNETATASGTLKHRFAWALVFWALLEGKVCQLQDKESS